MKDRIKGLSGTDEEFKQLISLNSKKKGPLNPKKAKAYEELEYFTNRQTKEEVKRALYATHKKIYEFMIDNEEFNLSVENLEASVPAFAEELTRVKALMESRN